MRRSFSYGDAVKLLGGDTALVKLLDHASAATVLATGGIDLLDARTEVVRLGKQLLSTVRERVSGLHRVDRTAVLDRPIVDGEVPSGLVLPTLEQAYVSPRFKVVEAGQGDDVSQDSRWSDKPVRSDLDDYLAGCLLRLLDLDPYADRHSYRDIQKLLSEIDLDVIAGSDPHLFARLELAMETIGLGRYMAR